MKFAPGTTGLHQEPQTQIVSWAKWGLTK